MTFPLLVIMLTLMSWGTALIGVQGQHFVCRPGEFEGPWEVRTNSGVYGVFFDIETWWHDRTPMLKCPTGAIEFRQDALWRTPVGPLTITQQALNVLHYFRSHKKQGWGWCGGYESLNGKHLVLDFEGPRVDLTFHSAEGEWTGTWSYLGTARKVTFRRPHPVRGVQPNQFIGDWRGMPSLTDGMLLGPTSLHIRESADGTIVAWLDQVQGAPGPKMRFLQRFQRNGWPLKVESAKSGSLILETESAMAPNFHYVGSLSAHGSEIRGAWIPVGGEHLSVPNAFRRFPLTYSFNKRCATLSLCN